MSGDKKEEIVVRANTNSLISELLEERKQVWGLYCKVSGIEDAPKAVTIETLLQEFCQMTVDYISLGHFGIYQRILDGSERRKSVVDAAEQIYPMISKATEVVLDFNDKYQSVTPAMIVHDLSTDLSNVGEQLANRIEWEDKLIGEMLA